MLVDGEARQRVGAGEHGLHGLGAVFDGEGVVLHGDRLAPGDVALDDRLAVVHVRVEPAGQPVQRDAGELAREVSLFVLPADLAVRHEGQARFGLFLDHLDRHLVQDLAHLFLTDLTAVESVERVAQASGTRPVGDLWIAASDGGDHVRPFWIRACAYEEGRSYDPRANNGVLERQHAQSNNALATRSTKVPVGRLLALPNLDRRLPDSMSDVDFGRRYAARYARWSRLGRARYGRRNTQ